MDSLYKTGDKFHVGFDSLILAITSDYKSKHLYHFQLINMLTGNRYSDKVVTHNQSFFSGITLDEHEMEYLIDEYPELTEAILRSHEEGPAWEEELT